MYNQLMPASLRSQAAEQFDQWHRRGQRAQLWSRLTGRRNRLLNLAAVVNQHQMHARHDGGLCPVPLAQIRGSEGRSADFDAQFRPLTWHTRERWISIATAHLREVPLPPVELVQINDSYFVRDEHHRVSVARLLGQREIDAQVTVWRGARITPPQRADKPRQANLASQVQHLGERLGRAIQRLPLPSPFGEDGSVQKV